MVGLFVDDAQASYSGYFFVAAFACALLVVADLFADAAQALHSGYCFAAALACVPFAAIVDSAVAADSFADAALPC